jgi:5-oxoprolinase (ATP-hydrolysing) subunit A
VIPQVSGYLSSMKPIDLNCDLGEGLDNEAALMPYISSCNIACGGHAGDEETIRRVVALAVQHQVAIGAHPSFEDREHFGRRELNIPKDELFNALVKQIQWVKKSTEEASAKLHHVKPHGALYNMAARSRELSNTIVESILAVDNQLLFYGMAHSEMESSAQGKLKFIPEAFADRRYTSLHQLMPRDKDGVLTGLDSIETQVYQLYHGYFTTARGTFHGRAQTICVHSDTPNALDILKHLTAFFRSHQIPVQAP